MVRLWRSFLLGVGTIAPYGLFFVGACLFFLPVLSCKLVLLERDLAVFFLPPRYLWTHLLKSGEFPFWNQFQYSGIPLLAALQPGVLYPPDILYLILPFNVAWNWIIILHFFGAGVTTYIFLRYLKASKYGSFVAGITFMLSGYLLSVHNLLTHLLAVPWLPLTIMFFLKHLERGAKRDLVFSAFFLAMEFLAGAPEMVIMTFLCLLVLSVFKSAFERGDAGVPRSPSFGENARTGGKAMVFVVLLFLFFSAVQFFPFYELKAHSIRGGGLSYEEAITWSFAWKDFMHFFLPSFFGYLKSSEKYWTNQSWLKATYLGIAPLCLSLFYFMGKDKSRWIFLALMGLSLLFAFGGNTPAYRLLYHLPPFNSIRFPVKFLFLFFFAISVTAGLGFDSLCQGVKEQRRNVRITIIALFYVGVLFVLLWGTVNLFESQVVRLFEAYGIKPDAFNDIYFNVHNMKRFFFFSFAFCFALFLYMRMRGRKLLVPMIIAIVAMDLFFATYRFYTVWPWHTYISGHGLVQALTAGGGTERYILTPKSRGEFDNPNVERALLSPACAPLFQTYALDGSEVLRIKYQDRFQREVYGARTLEDARRLLYVSGVRYLISSYEIKDDQFLLLRSIEVDKRPVNLYEYVSFPGRFLLFERTLWVNDDEGAARSLLNKGIDLRKELVLIGDSGQGRVSGKSKETKGAPETPLGKVKLVSYRANRVILDVDTMREAFLYVGDTYYPGWRAYLDGKETKIYRANLAFRAVQVPPGTHRVVFSYIPMSFYIGLLITSLGFGFALFVVLAERRRERRGGK